MVKLLGIHLNWNNTSRHVFPDAGIAMFNRDNTFLVLEVAVSQTEKSVKKKAQDYILRSQGKIAFVVLVMVERKIATKTTRHSPGIESAQENSRLTMDGPKSKERTDKDAYDDQSPKGFTQTSKSGTSITISTLTAPPSNLSS